MHIRKPTQVDPKLCWTEIQLLAFDVPEYGIEAITFQRMFSHSKDRD